ncbi:MAG: hypothetical protein EOP84_03760 [Verrucomicrobiaceae bacterium]|nr:MAG: hypothetical protein EOP84_03760 [Verrucomicrobiaceae bacterium]
MDTYEYIPGGQGLYGLYPANFVPMTEEDEPYTHERLEVQWLLAMWEYYMGKITKGYVYALTQGGVLTGVRLESIEVHYDVLSLIQRVTGSTERRVFSL